MAANANPAAATSSASLREILTDELERGLSSIRSTPATGRFSNWAGTYSCTPNAIFRAQNEDQLRYLIELAKRQKRKLRPFGAGHSPSDLVCVTEEDWLVNLDALDKVTNIDTEKHLVTAQGGIRLKNLHPILREHNLAISSLGSISDQSLAGAISTATHGASYKYGNLSSMVRSITIILADEHVSVRTVDKDNDPDLFQAALCSLGIIGIITRLTIECEPAFKLEEEIFSMKVEDFVRALSDGHEGSLAESAQHVRAWWHPQAREIKVSRMNRTNRPVTAGSWSPFTWAKNWIRDSALGYHWHQIGLLIGRVWPDYLTTHARFLYFAAGKPGGPLDTMPRRALSDKAASDKLDPSYPRCSVTTERVDQSVAVFNYDCLFPQYTYEGVVPIEATAACITEMQQWLEGEMGKEGGLRHHFPIEVRFTAADDVWMSPTNGMRGAYLGIVQYKPYGLPVTYRTLFHKFEEILFRHGGKPHWAKSHTLGPKRIAELFPRTPDFLTVRHRTDPDAIFLNPYARRHFFGDEDRDTDPVRFKTSTQVLEGKLHSD